MARDDWYRRTTWTPEDQAAFQSRLARSRDDEGKAQYLRIQAFYLAEAGRHEAALALIDQLLTRHAVAGQMEMAYLQRAECLAAIGDGEGAIAAFRSSLAARANCPGVISYVAMEFAWFITLRRQTHLYGEIETLLLQYESESGLWFPVQKFKCAVVRALIAAEQGRLRDALAFAELARQAASEEHSGLRYHPNLGLIGAIPTEVAQRLAAIGEDASAPE